MTYAELYTTVSSLLSEISALADDKQKIPEVVLYSYALTQMRDEYAIKACSFGASLLEESRVEDITSYISTQLINHQWTKADQK